MTVDAPLRIPGNHCTVHRSHRPVPVRTVKHHIMPQEFGGLTEPDNLVWVCDTGHYSIHAALDALLDGKIPPKVARAELALAYRGYNAIRASGRQLLRWSRAI